MMMLEPSAPRMPPLNDGWLDGRLRLTRPHSCDSSAELTSLQKYGA
jgi:hypothetical protein